MAKSRDKHPAEYYKSIIRKQSKIIKELEKKAGRGDKLKARYEDLEQELTETLQEQDAVEVTVVNGTGCPDCGANNLERISLGPKELLKCNNCGTSKLIK